MKNVALLAGLAPICVMGAPAWADDAAPAVTAPLRETIDRCEACHGAGGNSIVAGTPRLNGQQAGYILLRLNEFLDVTRETPHASFAMWRVVSDLTNSEKTAIANYFAAQPPSEAKAGLQAAEGKRIYENGVAAHDVIACKLCHGDKGEGHGVTARLAGQRADYFKTQLWVFSFQLRENNLMHPNTREMTGGEIDALASYLTGD